MWEDRDGQEKALRGEEGDDAADPEFDEATSYSANRHDSEQYTLPSVCLSHARQKSGDQSIAVAIVKLLGVRGGGLGSEL